MERIKKGIYPIIFVLLTFIVFMLFYKLNIKVPLMADDYVYTHIYSTNERVTSFYDVLKSQYIHYFIWGGRSVVHILLQSFLLMGKDTFNILNSLCLIAFIYLIYFHSNGKKNIGLFLIICMLLWFYTPVLGQTMLWVTGSSNYLWGTTIILLFMLPYKKYSENPDSFKNKKVMNIGMLILGILAGWVSENFSSAMILMIMLFIIYYKIKRYEIPKWTYIGFISSIFGFIMMLIAPGNFARASSETSGETRSFIQVIISRMISETKGIYYKTFGLLVIISILLLLVNHFGKAKDGVIIKSTIYVIGAIAAVYAMTASPGFPSRSWFGTITYMIIAIGNLYSYLSRKCNLDKLINQVTVIAVIMYGVMFSLSYLDAYRDMLNYHNQYLARVQYIEEQKSLGNFDLKVPTIQPLTKYNPMYELIDIESNKEGGLSRPYARYYGLDYISGY